MWGGKARIPGSGKAGLPKLIKKGPGYRGFNQIGNSVFVWMREMRIAKRFLKKIMVAAIIFDILLLIFEFRIIQFGAFCLGLKTSEIVYERTVQVTPK